MKKIQIIALFCVSSLSAWSQTNIYPETGDVTIGAGNLVQTGNYNLTTQGAVKLKNYLLFDADGDFTGGNYFSIQDHASNNYLRMGYGLSDQLVIKSSGFVGIGTNNPGYTFEVEKAEAANNTEYLLGAFNHSGNSGGVYIGYVGNGTAAREGRVRSGGNIDLALGTTLYKQAIVISNASGNVGIGTSNLEISGTGVADLVVGSANSSQGIVINAKSTNDGVLSFASDGVLSSRFIYNNPTGTLNFHKPGVGNILSLDNNELKLVTSISLDGSLGDLVSLFGDRIGQANMYGFGIESNGGTLYNKAVSGYNWYLNTNADQGASAMMKLTSSELVVDGKIRSEEVKVEVINAPDYVFATDYELRTLHETKQYISENRHLPEIPSALEMEKNGVELGDMSMKLLKKIEELTLYQIELLEKLELQNKRIEELENKLDQ